MIKIKGHFSRYLLSISCLIVFSSCPPGGVHINGDIAAFLEKGTKIAERNKKQQETFVSVDYNSKVVGLLRYVPEGKYTGRGSGNVSIQPFCMAETEVTQKAWQEVMGGNPSLIVDESKTSGDLPVNGISLVDAMKFCHQLSIKEGLEPVYSYQNQRGETIHLDSWPVDPSVIQVDTDRSGYRLPTVDEYHWASMGANRGSGYLNYGTQTGWEEKKFSGDTSGKNHSMSDYAWYQGNSGGKLQPVKKKKPNEIELYDLSGNASEWAGSSFQVMGGDFSDPEGQLALSSDFQQGTPLSESLVIEATEASATGPGIWEWKAVVEEKIDLTTSSKPQGSLELIPTPEKAEATLKTTDFGLSNVKIDATKMSFKNLGEQSLSGQVTQAEWDGEKWMLKANGIVANTNCHLTGIETQLRLTGKTGTLIRKATWVTMLEGTVTGTWGGGGLWRPQQTGQWQWTLTEVRKENSSWVGTVQEDWVGGIPQGSGSWGPEEGYDKKWSGTDECKITKFGARWDEPMQEVAGTIAGAKLAGKATLTIQRNGKELTFKTKMPELSLTKQDNRLTGTGKIKVTAPGFRVVRKPSR